jgi:hypothetical protein
MVLSADFVRNVQTHYLLGIDENHTGDIHYFNKAAALQAVSATNQSFKCGTSTDSSSIQCAINAGAQMTDYANNGLTSSADFGAVCRFPSPTAPKQLLARGRRHRRWWRGSQEIANVLA